MVYGCCSKHPHTSWLKIRKAIHRFRVLQVRISVMVLPGVKSGCWRGCVLLEVYERNQFPCFAHLPGGLPAFLGSFFILSSKPAAWHPSFSISDLMFSCPTRQDVCDDTGFPWVISPFAGQLISVSNSICNLNSPFLCNLNILIILEIKTETRLLKQYYCLSHKRKRNIAYF